MQTKQCVVSSGGHAIEFCLASQDPNGNPTDGILRVPTNVTSFGTNDAMKFTSQGGSTLASDGLHEFLGMRPGFQFVGLRPIPRWSSSHRRHCLQLHGYRKHRDGSGSF